MEAQPRTRIVLLGASNLTLAFPLVVGRLRSRFQGPLEILGAIGHGRSYGNPSRVLFRELPGIETCGLWSALDSGGTRETVALLADLGNDIAYGSDVGVIAGFVERSLDRLSRAGAKTTIVRMPIPVVERLSPIGFRVARGILFPGRTIDLPTVRTRVRALDERIEELARAHGATLVDQSAGWYGLDPIHIRRSSRPAAWDAILSALGPLANPQTPGDLAPSDDRTVRRARPERRKLFGREERRPQPCAELLDGTTISLY